MCECPRYSDLLLLRYPHCIIDYMLGNDRAALAVFRRYSFVQLRIDKENVEYFQGNKRAMQRPSHRMI